jgi:hypothetical protein
MSIKFSLRCFAKTFAKCDTIIQHDLNYLTRKAPIAQAEERSYLQFWRRYDGAKIAKQNLVLFNFFGQRQAPLSEKFGANF